MMKTILFTKIYSRWDGEDPETFFTAINAMNANAAYLSESLVTSFCLQNHSI